MVHGINTFKEFFGKDIGKYVFIGGTACDIILSKQGVDFRATKDLDIVLVIEAVDSGFVNRFIQFIKAGGYSHMNKGTGKEQFYRFEKPSDKEFPVMIELFSRRPEYIKAIETKLAPVHISDENVSLSAILLDDEYYDILTRGAVNVEGISVLDLEYILLFKIKAWLDLSLRKLNGESVDSRNISKHKNDIFRLAAMIEPGRVVTTTGKVKKDVQLFLEKISLEKIDLKSLNIRNLTGVKIMDKIKSCYT